MTDDSVTMAAVSIGQQPDWVTPPRLIRSADEVVSMRVARREFLLSACQAAGGVAVLALAGCGGATAGSSPAASAKTSASAPASLGTLKVTSTALAGMHTPLWLAENLGAWTKR